MTAPWFARLPALMAPPDFPALKLLLASVWRRPLSVVRPALCQDALVELGARVATGARARLGRSLALRAIDAGSCNGCELELHALNNAFYDLERFGIRFVASPRHADVLVITGPVALNMQEAVKRACDAAPEPKWVVAIGDCAADGGVFRGSYAVAGGAAAVVPVDLHIRGCPPTPEQLLQGLLTLLEHTA